MRRLRNHSRMKKGVGLRCAVYTSPGLNRPVMARNTTFLGFLCAWMTVLTLIPLYLLSTGRYALISENKREASQQASRGGTVDYEPRPFKRGVHAAGASEDAEKSFLEEPLSEGKKVDLINSKVVQDEIRRAFSEEQSSSSRAAFEQVVALSSLLPKITNISRIKTPSPETFRNYIAPMGLPVIFTDMLEGQKLGEWNWEYVRSKWGHVVYHNTRQGDYSTKTSKLGKHYINRVSVKLSDFIDIVTGKRQAGKSEEGMYITKQRVIPAEALEEEFYYPTFYPGSNKKCYLEPTGW